MRLVLIAFLVAVCTMLDMCSHRVVVYSFFVLVVRVRVSAFSLVHLTMSSQIRDNREMTSAAVHVASKWLLARVAVHVCLQRTWSRKPLVANLALVLLLRARRHLGAKLSHHRLRCWWQALQCMRWRQCSGVRKVGRLAGGAVVHRSFAHGTVVIRRIRAARGNRRVRRVSCGEAVRVCRS